MRPARRQPATALSLYARIYLKTWHVADAGTLLPQHSHMHPHLTLVVSGAVRVWRDGDVVGDFAAPEAVKIPARAKHMFQTLTNDVVLACIHATDAAEVEIAEEHQIVGEK